LTIDLYQQKWLSVR